MLKDTFNSCGKTFCHQMSTFNISRSLLINMICVLFLTGIVQYADIKMENGKSKGCGVVRFDSPETAERACRTMNGYRLSGREIDVRIDRNA